MRTGVLEEDDALNPPLMQPSLPPSPEPPHTQTCAQPTRPWPTSSSACSSRWPSSRGNCRPGMQVGVCVVCGGVGGGDGGEDRQCQYVFFFGGGVRGRCKLEKLR